MKKQYRKAVDIAYDAAEQSFAALPPMVFSNKNFYKDKSFKNAPKWSNAVKLIPSIKIMLQASDGNAIHQKNMYNHMVEWNRQNGMGMDSEHMEHAVLTQRAVICQMLNHKANMRSIPKEWHQRYACVWDMLANTDPEATAPHEAPEGDEDQGHADPEDDAVQVVTPKKAEPTCVDLVSDGSSDEIDADKLFSSDNPILRAILNPQHRITGKQTRPEIKPLEVKPKGPKPDFGMSSETLARLTAPISSNSVTPKHFKALNIKMKDKKKPKSKRRGKGHKKAKKNQKIKKAAQQPMKTTTQPMKTTHQPMKAVAAPVLGKAANPSYLAKEYSKREHSKSWKKALDDAIKAGKSKEDAKKAASAAGRARTEELRKKLKAGEINYMGQIAEDVN
jgi:hypothetical protein